MSFDRPNADRAFLRRVLAQREAEQEAAIVAIPATAFRAICDVCGRRMRLSLNSAVTTCGACRDPKPKEESMTTEPGICRICGTATRGDNTRGAHAACLAGPGGRRGAKGEVTTRQRFNAAARAIGQDPEAILTEYMTSWIDRLASAAGAK